MLSWIEIAAEAPNHFVAVKRASARLHVQTHELGSWVMLEPEDVVGVATVVLTAWVAPDARERDSPAVRVLLPVERLDWTSLGEACEEAAWLAFSLADPDGSGIVSA